ncbi:MAG: hypothetical protein AMXMBFR6_11710 [Betaproteobacteria bacterium]
MAPAARRTGLADILRRHASTYLAAHALSAAKAKVWRAIVACRTADLGGHVETCEACGSARHLYHSCRNRHCPLCQTRAKEAWLARRRRELLPRQCALARERRHHQRRLRMRHPIHDMSSSSG